MYRSRKIAFYAHHRLSSGFVVWLLCLLAMVASSFLNSACAGELTRTVQLLSALPDTLHWASDKSVKETALLEAAPSDRTITARVEEHQRSIASIQQQQANARRDYEQGSAMHRLFTLLPFSTWRLVSLIKIMKHYAAIASLQSKLIMTGTAHPAIISAEVQV